MAVGRKCKLELRGGGPRGGGGSKEVRTGKSQEQGVRIKGKIKIDYTREKGRRCRHSWRPGQGGLKRLVKAAHLLPS